MPTTERRQEAHSPDPAPGYLLPDLVGFARLAADSGHAVLISGETGCGKTHLARLIHAVGPRESRPFVRVNCAAIPDSLFEREMFGHVRGAFTDARDSAAGFLESANGGTLFLDEVSELAPQNQPKLLTVLDDGCFRKLGSPQEMRVDVQVIAASNRDLPAMVRERHFREDLFYRLSVLCWEVKPLRDRAGELRELAESILHRITPPGRPSPAVAGETLALLRRYPWPGNIRELENALRFAVIFARGGTILPEHLPPALRRGGPIPRASDAPLAGSPLVRTSSRYSSPGDADREVEMIREALAEAGGNKTAAARKLGMSRATLWIKLQRYSTAL